MIQAFMSIIFANSFNSRKLLNEHPEKTLLEKMKLAIKAANDREFERLKELELMMKHGVDISHVSTVTKF